MKRQIFIMALLLAIAGSVQSQWLLNGNSDVTNTSKLGSLNNKEVKFVTHNHQWMVLTTGGNLGINTNSPVATLHVQSTNGTVARFDGPAKGSMRVSFYEGLSGRGYFGSYYAGNPADVDFGTLDSNLKGKLHLTIQGLPALTIDTKRFVGVGTTTPGAKLHVVSTNNQVAKFDGPSSMYIGLYEAGAYRGYIGSFAAAANDVDFGTGAGNTTGKLHLTIQASPALTVDAAKFVGIGTTTPGAKLHISASESAFHGKSAAIEITNTAAGGANWYLRSGATGTATPKGGFSIANDALYALFISSAGNIGIGADPSIYKLDVCGTIRAKEVLVQTGWCDYVFDKNYNLRSLDEVENYINTNKHLPDVPSATEVENKGVKVAQMDSILIKKVEELTLYIIDQNKQIQQLQQKVIQLEKNDAGKKNQ
ncbi:MAG TPA: hypothetical protein VFW07_16735 [Parafilimonas sp.]|nr:hypothetical protein [Parafilimonas sp.]